MSGKSFIYKKLSIFDKNYCLMIGNLKLLAVYLFKIYKLKWNYAKYFMLMCLSTVSATQEETEVNRFCCISVYIPTLYFYTFHNSTFILYVYLCFV